MPERKNDIDMPLSESRKISMERFGLSSESKDYNLYRILDLTRRYLNAKAAAFSIPVRGGSAILEFAGGNIQEHATASKGCTSTNSNREMTVLSGPSLAHWHKECPSISGLNLTGYVGTPIFSPDGAVKGVMSVFFEGDFRPPTADQVKALNDFGRLIEDSLILRSLSIRDPLTQMFNRRYLEDQADTEWRRALRLQVPLSFAMIDVDHFKLYNDTAGHQAGDDVLIALANVISKACQRAGDSACRYGGEEFAVILPMTSAEDAKALMAKISQEFKALSIIHPGLDKECVSFSCGVTTKTDAEEMDDSNVRSCFKEADIALYTAKECGRNKIVHYCNLVVS